MSVFSLCCACTVAAVLYLICGVLPLTQPALIDSSLSYFPCRSVPAPTAASTSAQFNMVSAAVTGSVNGVNVTCGDRADANEHHPLSAVDDGPGWLVEGYANTTSVQSGQSLSLHLSLSASYPQLSCLVVSLNVYRFPYGAVRVDDTFVNIPQPHAHAALLPVQRVRVSRQQTASTAWRDGCQWPVSAEIAIPADWQPGLYVVRSTTESADSSISSSSSSSSSSNSSGSRANSGVWSNYRLPYLDVQFVVKLPLHLRGSYSSIVMGVASHTSQAYNTWTGQGAGVEQSFYEGDCSVSKSLSYLRPFAGNFVRRVAHRTSNFASPWQQSSVRVDLVSRWELHFLLYMHERRLPVELLTSVDLDAEGAESLQRERYNLFISVGHDEYWTSGMISAVEHFIRSGGNAAFLGGNSLYWRVHAPDPSYIVCDKSKNQTVDVEGRRNQSRDHLGFVSSRVTGLSFHGGQRESSRLPREANLYRALRPADDLFLHIAGKQTALRRFGVVSSADGVRMAISGYEADTIDLDGFHLPVGTADAPMNFVAIARETFAVMGYFHNGGTVFSGATTDYAAALTVYGDEVVQRLTQNVLGKLNTPAHTRMVDVHAMAWSEEGTTSKTHSNHTPLTPTPSCYLSTSPFPPSNTPRLRYSHVCFSSWLASNDRPVLKNMSDDSGECSSRGIYSWESETAEGRPLQILADDEQSNQDLLVATGFARSAAPLFFALRCGLFCSNRLPSPPHSNLRVQSVQTASRALLLSIPAD